MNIRKGIRQKNGRTETVNCVCFLWRGRRVHRSFVIIHPTNLTQSYKLTISSPSIRPRKKGMMQVLSFVLQRATQKKNREVAPGGVPTTLEAWDGTAGGQNQNTKKERSPLVWHIGDRGENQRTSGTHAWMGFGGAKSNRGCRRAQQPNLFGRKKKKPPPTRVLKRARIYFSERRSKYLAHSNHRLEPWI
jgi:hypothetical protein